MTTSQDDAGGQTMGLYEPQVGKMLLEGPQSYRQHFMHAGSAASAPVMQRWGRLLQLGIKYRNKRLVSDAMTYFLSTSGHGGEARKLAVSAAVGQVKNVYGKKRDLEEG